MFQNFLALFILFFSAQLLAKASSVDGNLAKPYVDSPQNCYEKEKYPCNLRISEGFLAFERGDQQFHLAKQSALLFHGASKIQVLQGQLWIRNSKKLTLVLSPALEIQLDGEFFVEKRADLTSRIHNLAGTARFLSKYVFASESLPLGFENWYGAMDTSGQVQRGVIRPIEIADFLKSWIPVSGLPMAQLKKNLELYRDSWSETTEASAQMYQQVIERRIASHLEKERKQLERRRSVEQDQSRYRQMFREKNDIPGN
jgi:hypothetical protein